MKLKINLFCWSMLLLFVSPVFAGQGAIDTGDTAWIFVATALVMMMTPAGLALFYGNPKQVWIQFVSIVGTAVFSAVGTLMVIYVTKALTGGLRVDEEKEVLGLDNAIHGERGFDLQL